MSEPKKLTVNEALDHYMDYSAMAGCQLAATQNQPFLTHASGEFREPGTDEKMTAMVMVYAGQNARELEVYLKTCATRFLTQSGEDKSLLS
jgi:hypothetical protein